MTETAPTHTGFTGALSFVPSKGWQPEHAREEVELLAAVPDAPFAPGPPRYTPAQAASTNTSATP
ncbi:hypothetical protein [Zhihengliuella salsuginis]|uniref:Uncharacterized protein n=1 Tax=Zhihengliuella salsuginis TaxID=578222 RepID=A0ABQ3GIX5_9MICC|nr:hypothetical protein [Zhihengliuella salsuginis]GHD06148.1 hypothetical protein GCM10008096_15770 [Zhihengliuella salsuginis]